jgi:chromosomal replication initiator protein
MPIEQTFETFVQLPSTSVAYRICRSKADGAPSPAVLILFGESGSGKTHLLRAVVDGAHRRSGRRVESTRAVDVVAKIVRELASGQASDAALRYYEQLDLLIVDDLQSLVSRPASQHCVGQLFRRIIDRGATIVCASGAAPEAMPELAAVLRAEPTYLPVHIPRPPRRELQRMIRHFADVYGVPLSPATVRLVAERCEGDLGRVHGMVAQFAAALRFTTSGAASAAIARVMRHGAAALQVLP